MDRGDYWKQTGFGYEPPSLKGMAHDDLAVRVVDDFLDDPVAARADLLALPFVPPLNPKRGIISLNALIPEALSAEMKPKLERILQRAVDFHPRSRCAVSLQSVPLHSVCHADGGDGMIWFNWAAVVYLNLPEQCRGGTLFYRHLPTGHLHNQNGMQFYEPDRTEAGRWELVDLVEMRFNRLVLFPAWRFHSPSPPFGTSLATGRLVLTPRVIATEPL